MLSELQKRGIAALLRSGWTYGQIATLLEMPPSIVQTVQIPRKS